MNRAKPKRAHVVDRLEPRMLLSATLTHQIPNAVFAQNGTPQTLSLGAYFNDPTIPTGDDAVEIQTNLAAPDNLIPLYLTANATPNTVANFLQYIANGEYANTIIHRSVPGFVIQGGGYKADGTMITSLGSISGESSTEVLNNSTGTIAMALSTGPNSATTEWYFNLTDNPELDNTSDGGPFTAFGKVIYQGLSVLDDIAALPVVDDSAQNGAWNSLPVISGTNGATVASEPANNVVTLNPVLIPTGMVYTINSSNTSVVTTSYNSGGLTLTPHSAGTATINITAEDLGLGTATDSFTVTVNAPATLPAVYVGSTGGTIGTNTTMTFPVTLSAASSSATTLHYALTPASADYQTTGSTLTIPAGSTSGNIVVNLLGDSSGAAETFTLTLSSLSSNATFANGNSTETAVGTIQPASLTKPALAIGSASGTIGTDTQLDFPVTLSSALSSATTLDFTLSPTSSDYQAQGSSLSIPAGSTTGNIIVTLNGDSTNAVETFSVVLSNLSSNAIFADDSATETATGTINPQPVPSVLDTSVALATSSPAVVVNGSETFTATVTDSIGTAVPTGTVAFNASGTTLGTGTLTNGVATFTTTLTNPGDEIVTAVYSGDSTHNASVSTPVTVNAQTLAPSVAKDTLPATVIGGVPAHGTTVVGLLNDTAAAESGTITVYIYASTDGSIDGSSVLVATAHSKVKIAPGKSASIPVPIKSLPANLSAGSYTLVSQTISTSGVVSNAATGPALTVTAPIHNLSETFSRLALPTAVVAGAKTSAVAVLTITDSGNVASTGPDRIGLYASIDGIAADGTLIKTVSKKLSIKPEKSINVSIPLGDYPAVSNGDYFIVAQVVDGYGASTQVASASTANIAAATADLSGSITAVPSTAKVGRPFSITVLISLSGNYQITKSVDVEVGTSPNSDGSAGGNGIPISTQLVRLNLKPGASQVLHLRVTIATAAAAGTDFITSLVDSTDLLSDSNRANNFSVSSTPVAVT